MWVAFLQIFILVDVLIIGLLAPAIYRHARAHFEPEKHAHQEPTDMTLPQATKERLLKDSETKFETTVTHAISQLQHNLQTTTDDINNLIKKLAVEVVSKELEQYRDGLAKLHTEAQKDLGGFKQVMDGHEAEMKAKLAEEMTVEKQRLVKQIDTKLGDAVSSFLLETLQHNVDLGSQSTYLMAVLEEHKAEFAKEVGDETPAA
jgi:hypothetical protein